MTMEDLAERFVNSIKIIAGKEENLENLKAYLSHHFLEWTEKYVATPEDLTAELEAFAKMEI